MPENSQSEQARNNQAFNDDEIDLVELVAILWRRRWLMVGVFVFIVGLAVAYCFIATPKYEIIAQVKPGISGFDKNNLPLYDYSAKDIQTWFQRDGYVESLVRKYGTGIEIPKIEASSGRDVNMLTLRFYWHNSENGKKILNSLIESFGKNDFVAIKKRIDLSKRMIEQDIERINNDIKFISIDKKRYNDEIEREKNQSQVVSTEWSTIKKNIEQTQQTLIQLKDKIIAINGNTQELMQLRQEMVKGDSDKFALLMYSNIIQQNITYVANLEQRVSDLEKQINNFIVLDAKKAEETKNIQINIKDLMVKRDQELSLKEGQLQADLSATKEKLSALSPIEVVQYPFSSPKPVRPAKIKIIAVSIVLGCFLALLVSFFAEFWVKNRARLSAD